MSESDRAAIAQQVDALLDAWKQQHGTSSSFLEELRPSVMAILDEFTGEVRNELLALAERAARNQGRSEATVARAKELASKAEAMGAAMMELQKAHAQLESTLSGAGFNARGSGMLN